MFYVLFIKLTVLYLSICQRQSVICCRQLTFVERVLEEPLKTDIASTHIEYYMIILLFLIQSNIKCPICLAIAVKPTNAVIYSMHS